jgi:hypothetical protein
MQKIIDNGTTVLLADDGMMLTDDNSFGTTVHLGKGDDGAKWYEITEEEAEKRMNAETTEEEATDEDYQSALEDLGVNFNE